MGVRQGGVQGEEEVAESLHKMVREGTFGRDPCDDQEPVKQSFRESSEAGAGLVCISMVQGCTGRGVRGEGNGQIWSRRGTPLPQSSVHKVGALTRIHVLATRCGPDSVFTDYMLIGSTPWLVRNRTCVSTPPAHERSAS